MYEIVYVDDILLTWSSFTLLHKLITKLHEKFYLKKLGIRQYFLGIEVHYQGDESMVLTQTKYNKYLSSKVNMIEENGVSTPKFSSCKLSKHGDDKILNHFLYKSIVGALQYVTLIHPNIAFCVNHAVPIHG